MKGWTGVRSSCDYRFLIPFGLTLESGVRLGVQNGRNSRYFSESSENKKSGEPRKR